MRGGKGQMDNKKILTLTQSALTTLFLFFLLQGWKESKREIDPKTGRIWI